MLQKFFWILSLLAGRLLVNWCYTTEVNLIKNGDFQQGLTYWQTQFLAPNEKKYSKNHENVSVVPAPQRPGEYAIALRSYGNTAASEGVKVVSELYPISAGETYEFGADVLRKKTGAIIFVEGYRKDPNQKEIGQDAIPGFIRCYRATIHVNSEPGKWVTVSRTITPKPPYQPEYIMIKLYCYHPEGTVYFTNVYLRCLRTSIQTKESPVRQ